MKTVLFFWVCKPPTWVDLLKKGRAWVLQTAQGFTNSIRLGMRRKTVHASWGLRSSASHAGLCQQRGTLKKASSFANCGNLQMVLQSTHTMGLCKMHGVRQTPCWQVVKQGCKAGWLNKLGLPMMGRHRGISPRAPEGPLA